jgi:outer membrane lipoprotein-sorting protein
MKKLVFVLTALIVTTAINAQSLDEIVKKYSEANKQDKISAMSTIKITGKMSMMGMDLPLEMWMKNPDKIKTVTNFNGQEMISVFDGTKGYSINPMTGSTDPVEMTPDQVKQTQNSNVFRNYMANYLKEGKLTLLGEENVNDKPAFKIKADLDGVNSTNMFIDKSSYLLVKSSATINQGGTPITVDSYPSDYKETDGVLLPMKTTSSAQGMDFTIIFDKVEVNIPMEDSVFKIK